MEKLKEKVTTLEELKAIMPGTKKYKRVPGIKQLQDMEDLEVYDQYSMFDANVIIYSNGFISYEKKDCCTVFALDRWEYIYYPSAYENSKNSKRKKSIMASVFPGEKVYYKDLKDCNYTLAICLIGEYRIENNANAKDEYYVDFHLDNDGDDWCSSACTPDFVDQVEKYRERFNKEKQEEENMLLLKKNAYRLTVRQREVLKILVKTNLDHTKAAHILGTTQANVSKIKGAAIKKYQKILKIK